MYCLKCGIEIEDDFDFCPECGTPIYKTVNATESNNENPKILGDKDVNNTVFVYCSECGAKVERGYEFCTQCGTRVFAGINAGTEKVDEETKSASSDEIVLSAEADEAIADFASENTSESKSAELKQAELEPSEEESKQVELESSETDHKQVELEPLEAEPKQAEFETSETEPELAEAKLEAEITSAPISNDDSTFCTNCGSKIDAGKAFCSMCGTKAYSLEGDNMVSQKTNPINKLAVGTAESKKEPKESFGNEMTRKRKFIRYAMLGSATLVILTLIVVIAVIKSHTINLNDYITVEYSGYDTKGYATVVFDEQAFLDEYGDKIKIKEMDERIYDLRKQLGNSTSAAAILLQCIEVNVDKTYELTNGDIVTTSWFVDDDIIQKEFNCRLVHVDLTHEVSNLMEVVEKDIFDGIRIIFYDYEPYICAYVEGMAQGSDGSTYLTGVNYTLSRYDNLSNGETVRVTASTFDGSSLEDYCVEFYGIKPVSEYKDYKVNSNSGYYYVKHWNDISSAAANDFFAFAKENVWGSIVQDVYRPVWSYSASWTTTSAVFVDKNMILIYHLKLEIKDYYGWGSDYNMYYPDFYIAVPFYDVIKIGNGNTYSYANYDNYIYSVEDIDYYAGSDILHIGSIKALAFYSEDEAWEYFRQFDCRNIEDWGENWG